MLNDECLTAHGYGLLKMWSKHLIIPLIDNKGRSTC